MYGVTLYNLGSSLKLRRAIRFLLSLCLHGMLQGDIFFLP